jgi:hypothetical protein
MTLSVLNHKPFIFTATMVMQWLSGFFWVFCVRSHADPFQFWIVQIIWSWNVIDK